MAGNWDMMRAGRPWAKMNRERARSVLLKFVIKAVIDAEINLIVRHIPVNTSPKIKSLVDIDIIKPI